ncbi:MAG: hypothetical protein PHY09_08825 [Desulfuromonadaceae bacterium]|nr:hypothetical protein [Desulfuromonadaceae bacterium]MDD5107527.1 hypothetical protein [Desulfuromonadaceae bacterium]
MRVTLFCLCITLLSAASAAAERTVTRFRDGSLYQQEVSATKGVIDIPLPASLLEQTLTVSPAPGTTILNVETHKKKSENSTDKMMAALEEQRLRLGDRLQALETREAIFTAAATSQSGKAPRKTKSNPDPLQSIRQGTDFAIAQLEAVYATRRTTTQSIRTIDDRLAAARKGQRMTEQSVRIVVSPPGGRVILRYATSERTWQPTYNLRLAGDGSAQLQLSARTAEDAKGWQASISPGSLIESFRAGQVQSRAGNTVLGSYPVSVTVQQQTTGIFPHFSGALTNSTPHYLPPGESSLFRNGAYIGRFVFDGLSSGKTRVITLGK